MLNKFAKAAGVSLVTTLLAINSSDAAIVSIEDNKSDCFTTSIQEHSNLYEKHDLESFSYLVLEKGTWQLVDNTFLELGTINTKLVSSKGWKNIDFTKDPLVFSKAQRDNGKNLVHTRQINTDISGFQLTMRKQNWNSLIEKSKTDSFIRYNQSGPGPRVKFNRTTIWEGGNFKGDYIGVTARPDAKALTVHLDSTGGFAAYVNEHVPNEWDEILRVDDVHQNVTIGGKVKHNLGDKNRWATGPKVSARPCNEKSKCKDIWVSGWYENYIIENSSWTPEQMHRRYTKPEFNGKYLGKTYHDGSAYKHYTVMHPAHGKWQMFWAVRQNYRESGKVHIAPILKKWRKNGMKNAYLDWVNYSMELFQEGPWVGTIKILDFETTDNWKTGK